MPTKDQDYIRMILKRRFSKHNKIPTKGVTP